MSKCIRVVGQGVPVRMSDEKARVWVEVDHDGEYCGKEFWKQWYAAHGTPRAHQ